MATQSIIIDSDWSLIANSADDSLLAQPYGQTMQVEYLATAANSAPETYELGHRLLPDQQMTRHAIGAGYIWARVWGRKRPGALVISGSSVDFIGSDSSDSDSES
jgi:hypothetical protein